jgi:hypothetical protein
LININDFAINYGIFFITITFVLAIVSSILIILVNQNLFKNKLYYSNQNTLENNNISSIVSNFVLDILSIIRMKLGQKIF